MKNRWTWLIIGAVVFGGLFFVFRRGSNAADEIEYRYQKIEKSELVRSTTATGVVVPLRSIDVRSKAGGTVVQLAVDEGAILKKGDLIAVIDPRDTQATYDQANADVTSADARIDQANANLRLQQANSKTSVADARIALSQAKNRLERVRFETDRTPETTAASISSAEASFSAAAQELERFDAVTRPQRVNDATGALRQSEAAFKAAEADLARNKELLEKGYVSQAVVDRAVSTYESARSAFNTAKTRSSSLERDLAIERESLRLAKERAGASLREARAQGSQVDISKRNLKEAEQAVHQAEIALQRAIDAQMNNSIRESDLRTAKSSAVRSKVALDNAKVQLDNTTVVAPTDGVVTLKYAEEGTVVPPGVSQFSTGSNIVQISDVTRLFVDCNVDEADIASVREGQAVRIVVEAYPGQKFEGVVRRVDPTATTTNSITAITVRVEIQQSKTQKVRILPGMNATCEFITLNKPDTLLLPSQALKRDGDKAYVMVKGTDPKIPVRKDVEIGEMGNDGFEVVSGLSEGDEVVVAEINLRQLRDTQRRMQEAQQGGGLAGGAPRMGGNARPTTGGGGAGGARGGMGGGGGGGR